MRQGRLKRISPQPKEKPKSKKKESAPQSGALHVKYRPGTFEEFIGNEMTVASLRAALKREWEQIPRAILITGPSGCGKTTLARIIKNQMGCNDLDFLESNTAQYGGVHFIRELVAGVSFSPLVGRIRIYLLDECHKLSNEAQNAFLKMLEEPPLYVMFILCTTEPKDLIPTLINRCRAFKVEPLNESQMSILLRRICEAEGIKNLPPDILREIIRYSRGSARRALVLLDAVRDVLPDKELSREAIRSERIIMDNLPTDI